MTQALFSRPQQHAQTEAGAFFKPVHLDQHTHTHTLLRSGNAAFAPASVTCCQTVGLRSQQKSDGDTASADRPDRAGPGTVCVIAAFLIFFKTVNNTQQRHCIFTVLPVPPTHRDAVPHFDWFLLVSHRTTKAQGFCVREAITAELYLMPVSCMTQCKLSCWWHLSHARKHTNFLGERDKTPQHVPTKG